VFVRNQLGVALHLHSMQIGLLPTDTCAKEVKVQANNTAASFTVTFTLPSLKSSD
jgi:hypothetical protein